MRGEGEGDGKGEGKGKGEANANVAQSVTQNIGNTFLKKNKSLKDGGQVGHLPVIYIINENNR